MAGVALMALVWLWWPAWFPFGAVVAAAACVAGVAFGDIDLARCPHIHNPDPFSFAHVRFAQAPIHPLLRTFNFIPAQHHSRSQPFNFTFAQALHTQSHIHSDWRPPSHPFSLTCVNLTSLRPQTHSAQFSFTSVLPSR